MTSRFAECCGVVVAAILVGLAGCSGPESDTSSPDQSLRNVIPVENPILNVFPPVTAEQSEPGVGKFVVFTREPTGQDWDYIAGGIPQFEDYVRSSEPVFHQDTKKSGNNRTLPRVAKSSQVSAHRRSHSRLFRRCEYVSSLIHR